MVQKIKGKSHRRRGGILILMLGITFIIALIVMLFLDVQSMYAIQYNIETRTQRALNSTVEFAMDDEWRKDRYNFMDVEVAKDNLFTYLIEDLGLQAGAPGSYQRVSSTGEVLYTVVFSDIQYYSGNTYGLEGIVASEKAAGIELDATITMWVGAGIFGQEVTWTQHFESTNFRTNTSYRGGR